MRKVNASRGGESLLLEGAYTIGDPKPLFSYLGNIRERN